MQNPHISIVTTLYRSELFLDSFVQQCYEALTSIGCANFEIVIVNDGSPDNSLLKILHIKDTHPEIKVVNLSRNFGHHFAQLAGISFAKGDYVFLIDCDLEVSPSILKVFYDNIIEGKHDVVFGYQEARKGKYVEKRLGGLFWKLFNALSDIKIPENVLTERLMSRDYVDALTRLGDKNIFLGGMMYWSGFDQKGIPIVKTQRKGTSTYTFNKRLKLLIDAISSFSAYPLKLLFKVGSLITLISFLYGIFMIVRKIIEPKQVMSGFTSYAVMILFSTGLIMSSLGIIGIYLEKIYNQTKNRPAYLIKKIYE